MRIGIGIDERGQRWDGVADQVRAAAHAGMAGAWLGQHFALDPLTTLAAVGREVPGIGLGTAVIVTHAQHPLTLASQALSVQAAVGDRLTLGIGVSTKHVVADQLGLSPDRAARHVREYLSALVPLLRGDSVEYHGETLSATGTVAIPGARPPSLLVAAHRPAMLRISGELADGAITNWAGPAALAGHIVPAVTAAAAGAGRPAPRVVAMVLVSITSDEAGLRRWVAEKFGVAGQIAGYRATLDQGGAAGPEDVVVVGDERSVERQLQRLIDAGATELVAMTFGSDAERERTIQALEGMRSKAARD